MKKLFILLVILFIAIAGFFVYKNIDNIFPSDNPTIVEPGTNNPSEEPNDSQTPVKPGSTPVSEGIELDKGYIYF